MNVLDYYIDSAPNLQNTIDLFKGEWASKFPGEFTDLEAGSVPLFEDNRVKWAIEQLGGVEGKTILELGPLEGGHSYMFDRHLAASIVAVEANSRAYLKCLLVKEILGLTRAKFLYGDCIAYLKDNTGKFDICCASGVLYHMANPTELLSLIARSCDRLFLWTHYYDAEIINNTPYLKSKFSGSTETEYNGFKHSLHRQEYQSALDSQGFCGGPKPYSQWMTRQGILDYLEYVGFGDIHINFELPNHPNGPSFSLTAVKRDATHPVSPPQNAVGDRQMTPGVDAQLQSRIQQLQRELQQAKDRVTAMESSKFWKLRRQWFKLKKSLGLPADE